MPNALAPWGEVLLSITTTKHKQLNKVSCCLVRGKAGGQLQPQRLCFCHTDRRCQFLEPGWESRCNTPAIGCCPLWAACLCRCALTPNCVGAKSSFTDHSKGPVNCLLLPFRFCSL
ncbi:Hypothetical predicted protein [Podarcis lilfordi]|uniref:Uncharacterized protein n=1 Tax=Podarcis lilfordi TaxID=74358 RepID=A0AA35JVS7_9SAUR|nr:Hypothetical predicted protein [Podarcis lilfordi]